MAVPVDPALKSELVAAAAAEAAAGVDLLRRLVEQPTVLGNEEPGQVVIAEAYRELGLHPVDVPMDPGVLRAHPHAAPFSWDVTGKRNVVAGFGGDGDARSLILNGHIDVVSSQPDRLWSTPPFRPAVDGDWMYGRGAGDMKSGLVAAVMAVAALRKLGIEPAGRVTLQSVVEEECGGNGALACVAAGYTADACVVVEPFGAEILTAQVGVLWFDVTVAGHPVHVGDAGEGANAIEAVYHVIRALRELEAELNAEPKPPPFDVYPHPLNLNVGVIEGGDWRSTVAGECVARFRFARYPGVPLEQLRARIEERVAQASAAHAYLAEHPAVVSYDGFDCEGYEIAAGEPVVTELRACHQAVTGQDPPLVASTATTDTRTFGLYGGIPSVCFGPYSEGNHAADERVFLPSITSTAQVLALMICAWCGVR